MDAGSADNERHESVRQRRVVPTPRCWRQCSWRQQSSGRYGGKRAVLRGDHVISRKAIAQGMSDVLRCPVCSCAHFLCTLRMRPRVQRASGIPCALFSIEGERNPADLGRNAPREREGVSIFLRHSGARVARTRNPLSGKWIPGSRQEARPGMTVGVSRTGWWARRECAFAHPTNRAFTPLRSALARVAG